MSAGAILTIAVVTLALTLVVAPVLALRKFNLSWVWLLCALPLVAVAGIFSAYAALGIVAYLALVISFAAKLHYRDQARGGEFTLRSEHRVTPVSLWRATKAAQPLREGRLLEGDSLIVGTDDQGLPVHVPFGRSQGRHTFIVGKTGYGKTVTQAYLAKQHILDGKGAVVVDPKGDELTRETLRDAAAAQGKNFYEWSPEGPCFFNPYKHGNPTEIANKALAAETYTEPHYLRQAQRYLGQQLSAMKLAGVWPPTPDLVVEYMDPEQLDELVYKLPPEHRPRLARYLKQLDDRQKRELGGSRDRLAILAESDIGPWLSPRPDARELDLRNIVENGDVAYIQLESDRYEEAAKMIGTSLVQDLVTIIAHLQKIGPCETLVIIDEFAAVAASNIASLFARGRSAGISLVLGTQSLADLEAASEFGNNALLDQVIDTATSLIVHQQVQPDSVETLSKIAGTEFAWSTTLRTSQSIATFSTGDGTRTRSREFVVHPDDIKSLGVGEAIVIVPGSSQKPRRTHILHPRDITAAVPLFEKRA